MKQAGVDIFISDKIDFKSKLTRKDKEGHYILIQGNIHWECIIILNIYAPNTRASEPIKETQDTDET